MFLWKYLPLCYKWLPLLSVEALKRCTKKYFNRFKTESKREMTKSMQTLAFCFGCQDEDVLCVVRKAQIETSLLRQNGKLCAVSKGWWQWVSDRAPPQRGKCWISTRPFPWQIGSSVLWGLGFGLELRARVAVAGQQLPLVGAELSLTLSPRPAGWPAQVDVKVPPAPSFWLRKAREQLFLLSS